MTGQVGTSVGCARAQHRAYTSRPQHQPNCKGRVRALNWGKAVPPAASWWVLEVVTHPFRRNLAPPPSFSLHSYCPWAYAASVQHKAIYSPSYKLGGGERAWVQRIKELSVAQLREVFLPLAGAHPRALRCYRASGLSDICNFSCCSCLAHVPSGMGMERRETDQKRSRRRQTHAIQYSISLSFFGVV